MSIITKFKKKPFFPRKLDNSILDKLVKFIDTDTGNVTYIQSQFSQVETDTSKEKGTYKTDNDFENLGEVELKLKQTSLNDCEIIHFENEEDLFKQVVLFIQRSTENYLAIAKDDLLDFVTAKASDSLYDKYHRGGVTSLICNSTFKTNHSHIGLHNINTNTDIIKAEFLPDNLAISIYQNEEIDYDITVLGYINRRKKWIKLKFITDYVTICSEDD